MVTKKQIGIITLIILVLFLSGYIIIEQIQDYGMRRYAVGLQEGQLVLAADNFNRQQCTFFNQSEIRTISIQELCK